MADETRRIVLELLARNKAKGELLAFKAGIDGVYSGVRRMAGGLLAMAGVGGIGYMIKQQMEAVDSTAKLSDRLGMTTESLVALQHGAKLAGVEQEQLTTFLEYFNRTLGEAQMGGTQAAKSFDQIGLSYQRLAKLSPEEQIGLVSDQINKLATQSQKAAAMQDLFGRGSQKLMPLLAEGSKGIAAYRSEAERLHLTFSRIDAAKVEAANDALTRMRAGAGGLAKDITIELAPAIVNLTEALTDSLPAWSKVFRLMGDGASEIARLPETLKAVKTIIENSAPKRSRTMRGFYDMEGLPIKSGGLPEDKPDISPRQMQLILEERERDRLIQEAMSFSGPLPGTEGQEAKLSAIKEILTYSDQLINSMRRENEILGMNTEERTRAKAIDEMREAIQRDINLGLERSTDLTEDERLQVEKLASEHLRLSQQTKQTTMDIAAAYARMYNDIDSKSAASFQAREQLLQEEYKEYDKVIKDKYALDIWFLDQQKKLAIERNAVHGGPLGGMAAGMDEIGRKALTVGEMFKQATEMGVDGFADSLSRAIIRSEDLSDAVRDLGMDIAQMLMKQAIMTGISAGLGGLFGGGSGGMAPSPEGGTMVVKYHGGGIVGRDGVRQSVNPAIFANAPRLHGGLAADEFPAILQNGEEVRSRADVATGGSANQRMERLLGQVVSLLGQRQTINLSANVVDRRDVVTASQMEGKAGEKWTMYHVGRNG